jgi:hypothetical protein
MATASSILSIEPKIRWRDLIHLDIKDPKLKTHVEGFLDFLEKSSFPYDFLDPSTGLTATRHFSGQEVFKGIRNVMGMYRQAGRQLFDFMQKAYKQKNIEYVEGKFTITDYNGPYQSNEETSACTAHADPQGHIPLFIQIGREYLKGGKQLGVDGKNHPVTVDGVVMHELTHLFTQSTNEARPVQIENIVTVAMGAVQRASRKMIFKRKGNGGYCTLYDKQLPAPTSIAGTKPAPPANLPGDHRNGPPQEPKK